MNKYLQPKNEKRTFVGKLYYSESVRAWNRIRLTKDLIREFGQLQRRDGKFFYELILFYQYEKLERYIKKMREKGEVPPLLRHIAERKKLGLKHQNFPGFIGFLLLPGILGVFGSFFWLVYKGLGKIVHCNVQYFSKVVHRNVHL